MESCYQENYIYCTPFSLEKDLESGHLTLAHTDPVASIEALTTISEDGLVNSPEIADPSQDIEYAVSVKKMVTRVHAFINTRTKRERAVIEMVYFKDMTRKACADAIGISPAAVTKILKRVFNAAREALSPYHQPIFA